MGSQQTNQAPDGGTVEISGNSNASSGGNTGGNTGSDAAAREQDLELVSELIQRAANILSEKSGEYSRLAWVLEDTLSEILEVGEDKKRSSSLDVEQFLDQLAEVEPELVSS